VSGPHVHAHDADPSLNLLRFAGILTALTFAVELAGGLWTNSVALLSDAGHVLMDLLALSFSFFALWFSQKQASERRTFGLHRLEVFAAFLNGALVTGLAVWIVVESLARLRNPPPVKTGVMLTVAILGLAVNLLVAWRLHGPSLKDLNLRGAFLHVASDALASLGVVVGGLVIHFTGNLAADPLVGLLVAVIIVVNAVRLLKDSIHILMEGVPKNMDVNDVVQAMKGVDGVEAVDDLHVWSICSHIGSLSAHVSLSPAKLAVQDEILTALTRVLHERFRINHTTIQIRSTTWKNAVKEPAS